MIEFQTDVPMPDKNRRGAPAKYPLKDMPIGASFFVASATLANINSTVRRHVKDGKRFTMRTVTEKGVKGVRVWRIA